MSEERTCMHEGCTEREHLTALDNPFAEDGDPDNETGDVYCCEHVPESYCYGCGYFCAGREDFDFAEERGGIKGLCWECTVEIRAECGEDEFGNLIEDDDEWGDYPDEAYMEFEE